MVKVLNINRVVDKRETFCLVPVRDYTEWPEDDKEFHAIYDSIVRDEVESIKKILVKGPESLTTACVMVETIDTPEGRAPVVIVASQFKGRNPPSLFPHNYTSPIRIHVLDGHWQSTGRLHFPSTYDFARAKVNGTPCSGDPISTVHIDGGKRKYSGVSAGALLFGFNHSNISRASDPDAVYVLTTAHNLSKGSPSQVENDPNRRLLFPAWPKAPVQRDAWCALIIAKQWLVAAREALSASEHLLKKIGEEKLATIRQAAAEEGKANPEVAADEGIDYKDLLKNGIIPPWLQDSFLDDAQARTAWSVGLNNSNDYEKAKQSLAAVKWEYEHILTADAFNDTDMFSSTFDSNSGSNDDDDEGDSDGSDNSDDSDDSDDDEGDSDDEQDDGIVPRKFLHAPETRQVGYIRAARFGLGTSHLPIFLDFSLYELTDATAKLNALTARSPFTAHFTPLEKGLRVGMDSWVQSVSGSIDRMVFFVFRDEAIDRNLPPTMKVVEGAAVKSEPGGFAVPGSSGAIVFERPVRNKLSHPVGMVNGVFIVPNANREISLITPLSAVIPLESFLHQSLTFQPPNYPM